MRDFGDLRIHGPTLRRNGLDIEGQGRVLGLGNSAAKAGALAGAGLGGLVLIWVPIEHVLWPVAAVYIVAAVGLHVMRRSATLTRAERNAPA